MKEKNRSFSALKMALAVVFAAIASPVMAEDIDADLNKSTTLLNGETPANNLTSALNSDVGNENLLAQNGINSSGSTILPNGETLQLSLDGIDTGMDNSKNIPTNNLTSAKTPSKTTSTRMVAKLTSPVKLANTPTVYTPTLDRVNATSSTIINDTEGLRPTYELVTSKPSGDYVEVNINGTTYYYVPDTTTYKLSDLQNLANTGSVALTKDVMGKAMYKLPDGTLYYYNKEKLPTSGYEVTAGTSTDYNFVTYTKDEEGKPVPNYYKIVLSNRIGTSKNITWSTDGTGATGSVSVQLPNETTARKLYYTVDESKYGNVWKEHKDNPDTIGSEDKPDLFIGASSSSSGGAIYNTASNNINIYADFVGNYANGSNYIDGGGAIYNSGTIGNITGDFIGNYAQGSTNAIGGPIFNNGGTIGDITGDFIGNYANSGSSAAYGGAICNSGTIGNITSDFIGNYAQGSTADGGAIDNYGKISNITGDFIGNYAQGSTADGGAIDNYGKISNITGDFIGNHVTSTSSYAYGGAINNNAGSIIENITGDFIGNSANGTMGCGGAICNSNYDIKNINGNFIGNSATTQGGAICHIYTTAGSISADFIANTANDGGAIYLCAGRFDELKGDFIGNNAKSKGGAIYIGGSITNITSDFTNNYVQGSNAKGGAIYNEAFSSYDGASTLNANEKDITFSGNWVGTDADHKTYNDIHNQNGTYYDGSILQSRINLTSSNGHKISFDGGITGDGTTNVADGTTLAFTNAKTTFEQGTINIQQATSGESQGVVIDLLNGVNQDFSIKGLVLNSDTKLSLNLDFLDQINGTASGAGLFDITSINLANISAGVDSIISTTLSNYFSEQTFGNSALINKDSSIGKVKLVIENGNVILRTSLKDITLLGTLDKIYDDSEMIVNDPARTTYTLSSDKTEGAVAVTIDGTTKYFTPTSDVEKWQNLANTGNVALSKVEVGTGVGTPVYTDGTYDYFYDTAKLPTSVYELAKGTSTDYNFVKYTKSESGELVPNYYKIELDGSRLGTSENITWSTNPTGSTNPNNPIEVQLPNPTKESGTETISLYYTLNNDTYTKLLNGKTGTSKNITWSNDGTGATGSVSVQLPNETSPRTLYYTVDETKYGNVWKEHKDNPDTIGSADKPDLFIGASSSSGGAIYNTANNNINIYADFVGNSSSGYGYEDGGGAIYNDSNATIGNITGDFIGNSAVGNGGAIFNKYSATIGNITGDFIGNSAGSSGGAIYNLYGIIPNITGDFIGNYASSSGGAISNSEDIYNLTGDFIGNYVLSSSSAYGGAIFSGDTISNITGDFIGNYASSTSADASGGAIHNSCSRISGITGDFIGNYATTTSYSAAANGGAIYNISGTIGDITGDFIGNYANGSNYNVGGGAIANNAEINNITGDFIGNYVLSSSWAYGGAIHNGNFDWNDTIINNIIGDFIGNHANSPQLYAYGGAIANGNNIYSSRTLSIGNITGDFIGNYALGSYSAYGGAIYNYATIGNITGDFIGNHANATIQDYGPGYYAEGGAICNWGTISNITGNFINNYVLCSDAQGGAIDNSVTISNISGDFIGNYTQGTDAKGGAIHNTGSGKISSITGDFIDNYAQGTNAKGGAIYNGFLYSGNNSTITLNANGKNITFFGNWVGPDADHKTYNDIHNENYDATNIGTLNLTSSNGHKISFDGGITGDGTTNVVDGTTLAFTNAKTTFEQGSINIQNAQSGASQGVVIDLQNGTTQDFSIKGLVLNSDTKLSLNLDFLDQINGTASGAGLFDITSINLANISAGVDSIISTTLSDYFASRTFRNSALINKDSSIGKVKLVIEDGNVILRTSLKDITLLGTLDKIYDASEGIINDPSRTTYTLSSDKTEGAVAVTIDGTTKYFTPTSDVEKWQNLANTGSAALSKAEVGTGVGTPVYTDGTYDYFYDTAKLPTSVYELAKGTSTDYNFIKYSKDESGELVPNYYKIELDGSRLGTSENITWSTNPTGSTNPNNPIEVQLPNPTKESGTETISLYYTLNNDTYTKLLNGKTGTSKNITWSNDGTGATGSVEVQLLNEASKRTLYYKVDETKYGNVWKEQKTNPGTIGSEDKPDLFIGAIARLQIDDCASGGAIQNYGAIYSINSDFLENYAPGCDVFGGAIDNGGTITNLTGDFIKNHTSGGATTYGGAIYNSGTITNLTSDFIGNYAEGSNAQGGAIYNSGTIANLIGDFIGNYAEGNNAQGGAIYNSNTISNLTSDFIGNSAGSNGGAIYNGKTIGNITGDFIGNSSGLNGGAINNGEYGSTASIGNITGDFIGNSSGSDGGAINNDSNSTIGEITGDFIENTTGTMGGAIWNNGTISNITGDFISNSSTMGEGGAIYNCGRIGNITGDFIGNYAEWGGAISNRYNNTIITNITGDFIGNSGGAIYNEATIGDITGDFIGNYTRNNYVSNGNGGAINNTGTINRITGDFIGNYTYGYGNGGAIDNKKTINSIIGDFIGNTSNAGGAIINQQQSTINSIKGNFIGNSSGSGGAIENSGTINSITGNFISNSASYSIGGAIDNYGTINSITGDFIKNSGCSIFNTGTIKSITGDFIDNNDSWMAGAIYKNNGAITLNANEKNITFSGNWVGTDEANKTYNDILNNIGYSGTDNALNLTSSNGHKISFDGGITGDGVTNVVDGTTLAFTNAKTTFEQGTINIQQATSGESQGVIIDLQNGTTQDFSIKGLVLNSDTKLDLNIDFYDQINGTASGAGKINIATIDVTGVGAGATNELTTSLANYIANSSWSGAQLVGEVGIDAVTFSKNGDVGTLSAVTANFGDIIVNTFGKDKAAFQMSQDETLATALTTNSAAGHPATYELTINGKDAKTGTNHTITGKGITVANGTTLNLGDVTFSGMAQESHSNGGAINGNVHTIGAGTKFINNTAGVYDEATKTYTVQANGGAINGSVTEIVGTADNRVLFQGNKAYGKQRWDEEQYKSIYNGLGGAINTNGGNITKIENADFIGNEAYYGGAINLMNFDTYTSGKIDSIKNSTFQYNKSKDTMSGAIYGDIGTIGSQDPNDGRVLFSHNTSADGAAITYMGGIDAIYNTTFEYNIAEQYAGAIQSNGGKIKLIGEGTIFDHNEAQKYLGGAVIAPVERIIGTSNNKVVFSNNTSGGTAGAIHLAGITDLIQYAEFSNNEAATNGGAVYGFSMFYYDSKFEGNEAGRDGGAIYYDDFGQIQGDYGFSIQNTEFSNNKAGQNGGAIYNVVNKQQTIGFSKFDNNSAVKAGGAIYNTGFVNIITDNFTGNHAGEKGGAIYNAEGATVYIDAYGDVVFSNNWVGTEENKKLNDIYNAGTLQLGSFPWSSSAPISFDGGIDGTGTTKISEGVEVEFTNANSTFTQSAINIGDGVKLNINNSGQQVVNNINLAENAKLTLNMDFIDQINGRQGVSGASIDIEKINVAGVEAGTTNVLTTSLANYINNTTWSGSQLANNFETDIKSVTLDKATGTFTAVGLTFAEALRNEMPKAERNYKLLSGETLASGISTNSASGHPAKYTLNVDGNNQTVTGKGFKVSSGTTLSLKDMTFDNNKHGDKNTNVTGGAIYNAGTIDIINAKFNNNGVGVYWGSAQGGAIYNTGVINNLTGEFRENIAGTADCSGMGGAIYNANGATIGNIEANFINNYTNMQTSLGQAIYNEGTINNITSLFNGNGRNNSNSSSGALYNKNVINNISDSTFIGNYAHGNTAQGGAIYNLGTIGNIQDTTFSDNYAQGLTAQGGAIYNEGSNATIGITAATKDVTFSGNYVANADGSNKRFNDIYNNGGTINLNAAAEKKISFGGSVEGSNGILNINSIIYDTVIDEEGHEVQVARPTDGSVVFNDVVTGNQINLYNGTVEINKEGEFAPTALNVIGNGSLENTKINIQNGKTQTVKSINIQSANSNDKLAMDIDFFDRIEGNSNGGMIDIKTINLAGVKNCDQNVLTESLGQYIYNTGWSGAQLINSGSINAVGLSVDNKKATLTAYDTLSLESAIVNVNKIDSIIFTMYKPVELATSYTTNSIGKTPAYQLTINGKDATTGENHTISGKGIIVANNTTLDLADVTFSGMSAANKGDGGAINGNVHTIGAGTKFINNTAGVYDETTKTITTGGNGGAINGSVNEILGTADNHVVFQGNIAYAKDGYWDEEKEEYISSVGGMGAAINTNGTNIKTIAYTDFTDNGYENSNYMAAGTIYMWGNAGTGKIENIDHSTFLRNNGTQTISGNVGTISNSEFSYNKSEMSGVINGNVDRIENSVFSYNKGSGGAAILGDVGTISGSEFSYNESQSDGGAIGAWYSNYDIESIDNTVFSNNKAGMNGGALFANVGTIGAGTQFINNTAGSYSESTKTITSSGNGGAISGSVTKIEGTANNHVVFQGNEAYGDGTNNNYGYGGAIYGGIRKYNEWGPYTEYTNIELIEYADFINNKAIGENYSGGCGGAIYGNIGEIKNSTFEGNEADGGGAISSASYHATKIENSRFVNNKSGNIGGALHNFTGSVTDSYFEGNEAEWSGAIDSNSAQIYGNTTFKGNKASSHGGAIHDAAGTGIEINGNIIAEDGSIIRTGKVIFENNEATLSGGAISTYDTASIAANNIANAEFKGNTAKQNGGAIFGVVKNITDTTFTNNEAGEKGGAIYTNYASSWSTPTMYVMDITADKANVTFSGNKAKEGADIWTDGQITLNANAGKTISFDGGIVDKFASTDTAIAMQINNKTGFNGTVEFKNGMTVEVDKINLVAGKLDNAGNITGEVKVHDGANLVSSGNVGSILNSGNVQIAANAKITGNYSGYNGSSLDIQNGVLDTIKVATLEDSYLKFDVNLLNFESDKLNFNGASAGAHISFGEQAINLLAEMDEDVNTGKFQLATAGIITDKYTIASQDATYILAASTVSDGGWINVTKDSGVSLSKYIQQLEQESAESGTKVEGQYDLKSDMHTTKDIGTLQLAGLILNGTENKKGITSEGKKGITLNGDDASLRVENLGHATGFVGGFVDNKNGTVTIANSNISGNADVDIINNDLLVFEGNNNIGVVNNSGNAIVNSVKTEITGGLNANGSVVINENAELAFVGDATLEQNNVLVNKDGKLSVDNASKMNVANLTNEGVFNVNGGKISTDVNGEGNLNVNGNVTNENTITNNVFVNTNNTLQNDGNIKGNVTIDTNANLVSTGNVGSIINSGNVKIAANATISGKYSGLDGSSLDIKNGVLETVKVASLEGNTDLKFDVNLNTSESDKLNFNGVATNANINFGENAINVLADMDASQTDVKFQLADVGISTNAYSIASSEETYFFAASTPDDKGVINVTKGAGIEQNDYIQELEQASEELGEKVSGQYDLKSNTLATKDIGTLSLAGLVLNGKNNEITSENQKGITLDGNDASLRVENLAQAEGFNGGFIDNKIGTVTIIDSNISDANADVDINNSDMLIFENDNKIGAVNNSKTAEVRSGKTEITSGFNADGDVTILKAAELALDDNATFNQNNVVVKQKGKLSVKNASNMNVNNLSNEGSFDVYGGNITTDINGQGDLYVKGQLVTNQKTISNNVFIDTNKTLENDGKVDGNIFVDTDANLISSGNVNSIFNSGNVKIAANATIAGNYSGFSGSSLDIENGVLDSVNIGSLEGTSALKFDVNLKTFQSDVLNFNGAATNTHITFGEKAINILADMDEGITSGSFQLADVGITTDKYSVASAEKTYILQSSTPDDKGIINIDKSGGMSLSEYIQQLESTGEKEIGQYDLSPNTQVTQDIGTLQLASLTLNGKGNDISSTGQKGITLNGDDASLRVENLEHATGFVGGFVDNKNGTVTIANSNISGNADVDIINNDLLVFEGNNNIGVVNNSGNAIVNSVKTEITGGLNANGSVVINENAELAFIGDATLEQNNVLVNKDGKLSVDNASKMNVANLTNEGVFNVNGGKISTDVNGEGNLNINGDITNEKTITNTINIAENKSLQNDGTITGNTYNKGTLKSNVNNIQAVDNTGNYYVSGEGNIAAAITGKTGITHIEENSNITNNNAVNIENAINISENAKLTSNADNILNKVTLADNSSYNITGGKINAEIVGGGITNILENSTVALAETINLSGRVVAHNGSTFDMMNGAANTVSQFEVASGAKMNLNLDIDDKIDGTPTDGTINLAKIDLSKAVAPGDRYQITDTLASNMKFSADTELLNKDEKINFLTFSKDNGKGTIAALQTTLDKALEENNGDSAFFTMQDNEILSVAKAIGGEIGGNFVIDGQGNNIIGGGIIVDKNKTLEMKDANFVNASTEGSEDAKAAITVKGGSSASIIAQNSNVVITGTNNGKAVALESDGGNSKVTIEAKENQKVVLDDGITSDNKDNVVDFNGAGTIIFNGEFDNATSNVNAKVERGNYDNNISYNINEGGHLHYTKDLYLYDPSLHGKEYGLNSINMNGGALDLRNDAASRIELQELTISTPSDLYLDVDLAALAIDNFGDTPVMASESGKLHIAGLNLVSDATLENTTISFTDNPALMSITDYTGSDTVYAPVYKYNVNYNSSVGDFNFQKLGGGVTPDPTPTPVPYNDLNPGVMNSAVAAQVGAYSTVISTFQESFSRMDMAMAMPLKERRAIRMRNKYSATGNVTTFNPNQFPEERQGIWFTPYTSYEKVDLKNGPNVENFTYGGLVGYDSKLIELKNGWDATFTGFAGYNGSRQAFDGVNSYLNGGTLGATAVFYKDNFFTGLTANVGASNVETTSPTAKDDFALLSAGIASKTGYNWELADGKFIIQPSLQLAYTFINAFDHTNSAGVRITSDPLNTIQIAPGIKFIGNLSNGWQPYAGIQMVWNIMDTVKSQADGINLPETSTRPYLQYGVGVQKHWGDRCTGYIQTGIRNGGRTGIAVSGGFRWALGPSPSDNTKKSNVNLKTRRTIQLSSF